MPEPEADFETAPALAMVATSGTKLPDAAKLVAACDFGASKGGLSRLFSRAKPAPATTPTWDGQILVFSLRDMQVSVALMPTPIPWSELEGPCATSWLWTEATECMQAHTNHFLVALTGGSMDPIERRLLLTKLVSAVVFESDAVGVYWGDGTLVVEPKMFVEMAQTAGPKDLPVPIWVDLRIAENDDDTVRCFTEGMAPLGFLEIEVPSSTLPAGELLEFIGDTACYILNGRIQIPDGDTMGRTADEKYKVTHGQSMFDRPEVMRLEMI